MQLLYVVSQWRAAFVSEGRTAEQGTAILNFGIFLEINKVNLSLRRSNWQYLLLMTKSRLSSENEIFGKTRICHWELANLPRLKDISDEIGGDTNKCDFLILQNEMFNVWRSFIIWRISISQMTNA